MPGHSGPLLIPSMRGGLEGYDCYGLIAGTGAYYVWWVPMDVDSRCTLEDILLGDETIVEAIVSFLTDEDDARLRAVTSLPS